MQTPNEAVDASETERIIVGEYLSLEQYEYLLAHCYEVDLLTGYARCPACASRIQQGEPFARKLRRPYDRAWKPKQHAQCAYYNVLAYEVMHAEGMRGSWER